MSVIIRLQNLSWIASALDVRQFFHGLSIPDGGVHIIGGEMGDAFIAFSTDEDARQAMMLNGRLLNECAVRLLLSSKTEMQNVIAAARAKKTTQETAPVQATEPPPFNMQPYTSYPQGGEEYGYYQQQQQQGHHAQPDVDNAASKGVYSSQLGYSDTRSDFFHDPTSQLESRTPSQQLPRQHTRGSIERMPDDSHMPVYQSYDANKGVDDSSSQPNESDVNYKQRQTMYGMQYKRDIQNQRGATPQDEISPYQTGDRRPSSQFNRAGFSAANDQQDHFSRQPVETQQGWVPDDQRGFQPGNRQDPRLNQSFERTENLRVPKGDPRFDRFPGHEEQARRQVTDPRLRNQDVDPHVMPQTPKHALEGNALVPPLSVTQDQHKLIKQMIDQGGPPASWAPIISDVKRRDLQPNDERVNREGPIHKQPRLDSGHAPNQNDAHKLPSLLEQPDNRKQATLSNSRHWQNDPRRSQSSSHGSGSGDIQSNRDFGKITPDSARWNPDGPPPNWNDSPMNRTYPPTNRGGPSMGRDGQAMVQGGLPGRMGDQSISKDNTPLGRDGPSSNRDGPPTDMPQFGRGGPPPRRDSFGPQFERDRPPVGREGPQVRSGGPPMGRGEPQMGRDNPQFRRDGPNRRSGSSGGPDDSPLGTHGLPMRRDGPQPGRDGPPFGRGSPPFGRDGPPMNRDGMSNRRDGPPFGPDGPPFGKDGLPMRRDGPPPGRDAPPFGRDGPPMNRDGMPMSWDGPPMGRYGPPFGRDGSLIKDGTPVQRDGPPLRHEGQPKNKDQAPVRRDGPPLGRDGPPRNKDGLPVRQDNPPQARDDPPRNKSGNQVRPDEPPVSRGGPPHVRDGLTKGKDGTPVQREATPKNKDGTSTGPQGSDTCMDRSSNRKVAQGKNRPGPASGRIGRDGLVGNTGQPLLSRPDLGPRDSSPRNQQPNNREVSQKGPPFHRDDNVRNDSMRDKGNRSMRRDGPTDTSSPSLDRDSRHREAPPKNASELQMNRQSQVVGKDGFQMRPGSSGVDKPTLLLQPNTSGQPINRDPPPMDGDGHLMNRDRRPIERSGPGMNREGPPMTTGGPLMNRDRHPMERCGPLMNRDGPPMGRGGPFMIRDRPPMDRDGPSKIRDRLPMERGGPSIERDGPPMNRDRPPMDRGGPPMERGGPPLERGGPPLERGGPPMERGGPPMERGGRPLERGGPPLERGGPPMDRGGRPLERGGPPLERGGPPMDRGGPPLERGGPPMNRNGPPMERGGPPMERGGPPMNRNGPPMERGGPPMERGGPPMERGGPPMQRGGPPMERGGPPIERSGPPINRNGHPMERGGPPMNRDRFPMERHGPFMNRDRSPMENDGPPMNRDRYPMERGGPPVSRGGLPVDRGMERLDRDGRLVARGGPPFNRDGQQMEEDGRPWGADDMGRDGGHFGLDTPTPMKREDPLMGRGGPSFGRERPPMGRDGQPFKGDALIVDRQGIPFGRDASQMGRDGRRFGGERSPTNREGLPPSTVSRHRDAQPDNRGQLVDRDDPLNVRRITGVINREDGLLPIPGRNSSRQDQRRSPEKRKSSPDRRGRPDDRGDRGRTGLLPSPDRRKSSPKNHDRDRRSERDRRSPDRRRGRSPRKRRSRSRERSSDSERLDSRRHSQKSGKHAKLIGLHQNASYKDVRKFFGGVLISNIKLFNSDTKKYPVGYAYIEFSAERDRDKALRRSGDRMMDRVIRMESCNVQDYERSDEPSKDEGPSPAKRSKNTDSHGKEENWVELGNLPSDVKKANIFTFFKDFEVNPGSLFIEFDKNKRDECTGKAFLEFGNHVSRTRAIGLHRRNKITTNLVEIREIKRDDANKRIQDRCNQNKAVGEKKNVSEVKWKPIGAAQKQNEKGASNEKSETKTAPSKGFEIKQASKPAVQSQTNKDSQPKPSTKATAAVEKVESTTKPDTTKPCVRSLPKLKPLTPVVSSKPQPNQQQSSVDKKSESTAVTPQLNEPTDVDLDTFVEKKCMVGMKNLPPPVSVGQVLSFLQEFQPIPGTARLNFTDNGHPTGEAMVAFKTPAIAMKVIEQKKNAVIRGHTIMVFLVT